MNKFIEWLNGLFKSASVPIKAVITPKKSSRKLSDAEHDLQTAFRLIREYYRAKNPGHTLVLTDVYRHPKKQRALYAQGRTKPGKIVTYVDGFTMIGKHNYYPSRAIDVAVKNASTGKITWENKMYKPLGAIVKRVQRETGIKLTWGGNWKKPVDMPHIEVR